MPDLFPGKPGSLLGGTLLGAALATAGWVAHARRRAEHARLLHRSLVDALLNVLTADDSATARHSRRVADLTDALARALRLSREEHATLRLAALLHDMGKVDDRYFDILHSRQPLTPEQRTEIKGHPHQSAHILEPLERFHPGIMEIVSSHHECWNGKGYPQGRAGEEIPLGARMIAVADVFDAVTQPRRYSGPTALEEGLDVLREGAGSQFDPEIVALVETPEVWTRWRDVALRGHEEELVAQTTPATGAE